MINDIIMPTGSDRMGSISRYELLMYLLLFVIDSSIHKKILISKFFVFSEIGFFPIFQIPVFLPIFVNRDFLVEILVLLNMKVNFIKVIDMVMANYIIRRMC